MNVGNLCERHITTIGPRDDLTVAARLMREKHIGYLVVVEPEPGTNALRPIGVLTDRDIVVSVVAKNADPKALLATDVMSMQPITIGDADPVDKALQTLRRTGVRRLPVVGSRGELVGVLSLDDLLDYVSGEIQNLSAAVRNERQIEGVLRP
ncbi:MAG TPA: CBS domain-containing protein [Steroidobacteraceae bacterium]|nr:CBS domain-containing protein [Steroidobacteraceae bacterium]